MTSEQMDPLMDNSEQQGCIFGRDSLLTDLYGSCSGDHFPLNTLDNQSADYNYKGFLFKPKDIDSLAELLRCRGRFFSEENPHICDAHVRNAGYQWRSRKTQCAIPTEFSDHGAATAADKNRPITRVLSEALFVEKSIFVPVGSSLCRNCQPKLKALYEEHQRHITELDMEQATSSQKQHEDHGSLSQRVQTLRLSQQVQELGLDANRPLTQAETIAEQHHKEAESLKQQTCCNEALRAFCSVSGAPKPKCSQNWQALKPETQDRRLRDIVRTVEQVILVFAPNDAQTVLENLGAAKLSGSSQQSTDEVLQIYLGSIAEAYRLADNDPEMQRTVLSLAALSVKHSVLQQFIPGLNAYSYSAARKFGKQYGKGKLVQKKEIHKTRFDKENVQDFITFLCSSQVSSDLPWGEVTMKLSDGSLIEIPKMCRRMHNEQIVQQYISSCEERGIGHLSRSTLIRILNYCPASYRKCLAGLDNYAYYGGQGFKMLSEIVDKVTNANGDLAWGKQTKRALQFEKRYIAADYKAHLQVSHQLLSVYVLRDCKETDTVPDHCISHMLSDPSDPNFSNRCNDHEHTERCDRCEALKTTFDILIDMVEAVFENDQDEMSQVLDVDHSVGNAIDFKLLHDVKMAVEKIEEWKEHQIRSVQQEKTRTDIIQQLLPGESAYLHCDFGMKWQPLYYHEPMSKFFSKRGMPWHVTSCIRRVDDEEFEECNFIHGMEQSAEDSNAVTAILEDCINQLKADMPDLKRVMIRGVLIEQFGFTEAQDGKGRCDQIGSVVKGGVRSHAAQGNDVLTMADFIKAAKSSNIRHTTFNYGEIVTEKTNWQGAFPGITKYNNFKFTQETVTYWRAYGIGPGVSQRLNDWNPKKLANKSSFEPYQAASDVTSGELQWEVIGKPKKLAAKPTKGQRPQEMEEGGADDVPAESGLFLCSNEACSASFVYKKNLEKHENVGKHKIRLQQETLSDAAKLLYEAAQEFSILDGVANASKADAARIAATSTAHPMIERGTGLKERKPAAPFSDAQRQFLAELYDHGEQNTSQKSTPEAAAQLMRSIRTADGGRRFSPNECLEESQIRSWWQRYPNTKFHKERNAPGRTTPRTADQPEQMEAQQTSVNGEFQLNEIETDPWKMVREELAAEIELEHRRLTDAAFALGPDPESDGEVPSTRKRITEGKSASKQELEQKPAALEAPSPLKKKPKTEEKSCKPPDDSTGTKKKDDSDDEDKQPPIVQRPLRTFKPPLLSSATTSPTTSGSKPAATDGSKKAGDKHTVDETTTVLDDSLDCVDDSSNAVKDIPSDSGSTAVPASLNTRVSQNHLKSAAGLTPSTQGPEDVGATPPALPVLYLRLKPPAPVQHLKHPTSDLHLKVFSPIPEEIDSQGSSSPPIIPERPCKASLAEKPLTPQAVSDEFTENSTITPEAQVPTDENELLSSVTLNQEANADALPRVRGRSLLRRIWSNIKGDRLPERVNTKRLARQAEKDAKKVEDKLTKFVWRRYLEPEEKIKVGHLRIKLAEAQRTEAKYKRMIHFCSDEEKQPAAKINKSRKHNKQMATESKKLARKAEKDVKKIEDKLTEFVWRRYLEPSEQLKEENLRIRLAEAQRNEAKYKRLLYFYSDEKQLPETNSQEVATKIEDNLPRSELEPREKTKIEAVSSNPTSVHGNEMKYRQRNVERQPSNKLLERREKEIKSIEEKLDRFAWRNDLKPSQQSLVQTLQTRLVELRYGKIGDSYIAQSRAHPWSINLRSRVQHAHEEQESMPEPRAQSMAERKFLYQEEPKPHQPSMLERLAESAAQALDGDRAGAYQQHRISRRNAGNAELGSILAEGEGVRQRRERMLQNAEHQTRLAQIQNDISRGRIRLVTERANIEAQQGRINYINGQRMQNQFRPPPVLTPPAPIPERPPLVQIHGSYPIELEEMSQTFRHEVEYSASTPSLRRSNSIDSGISFSMH